MYVSTSWLGMVVIFAFIRTNGGLPNTIRIGGLFETEYGGELGAFKFAVEKLNLRNDILGQILLVYDVLDVPVQDSFQASKKVCRQIKEGVAAIFGPVTSLSSAHVQSICNTYELPHIQFHWDSRDTRDYFSISVYPHYLTLSRAYRDLILYWGWKKFTVLYEDNEGLIRLQEVLKANESEDYKVTVRKLDTSEKNYVNLFKELKEKDEVKLVIDCDVYRVKEILHQALKVNMVSEYNHYLFTTLDLGLVDLEDYKYGGANITSLRIIDPQNPKVMNVMSDWSIEEMRTGSSPLQGQREIKSETALVYDGVHLLARSLHELSRAHEINTTPLSCSKTTTWEHGRSLLNYMKSMDFEGLSGRVQFTNGERSEFVLDVLELTTKDLQKIGIWSPKTGINITKTYYERRKQVKESLANKTLSVVTVLDKPYVMEASTPGGPQYEGFAVDLLDMVAKSLKFNYTMYVAPDGKYGAKDKDTGEWNGMVRELIERKADLAVAGISITYKREEVIDFTKPFLNLGITILFKKPEKSPPKLFSFLSPLSIEVWVYMLAAYLCVSFMLFVIARFSPYEWCNPHPCNPDADVVENQFTILNSLWFTIGSLMQQGCELAPRAISTRLVSGIWWFFTLIMISSYTANLAAFLTVERMVSPIEGADDLAKQTRIKYGTLNSGSTKSFFEKSNLPTYQRMWNFMQSTEPSVFVNSSSEGLERVKTGEYAYLAESTTIEYEIERNCDLMKVGGLLDSKGYGIATPQGSDYKDLISSEILRLQEEQDIHRLHTKWWKEKSGGKCNVDEKKKQDASALGVTNVGGVFVVLVGGIIAGCFVAMCEFLWKARKNAKEDKQSLCSEMAEELRFAVRCIGSSKKPLKRKPSKDILDNGLQFMPLTGVMPGQNSVGGRELYA
ncbi:hypothetical protein ScPMuIL_012473 [Solemya velum]